MSGPHGYRPGGVPDEPPAVPPQFRQGTQPNDGAPGYGQAPSQHQGGQRRPQFHPSSPGWAPPAQPVHHGRPAQARQQAAAPSRQRQGAAARSLPPYPWHQVRFPWKALPGSRRRRGPSLGRMFYLGRHPVAMLFQLCMLMIALEVVAAWVVLVAMFWALQVTCVTIGWLWQCSKAKR